MTTPDRVFLMAGGGTGGHVIPALAVARELRKRGHSVTFVGTAKGLEARLVPSEGFEIEWIEIGGLKRVGATRMFRTLGQLPASVLRMLSLIRRLNPAAVFSMGGYAAGPVVLAAWLSRTPIVVMEPNVVPGFTNRNIGRFVGRALLSFPETARWFPPGRSEVTGLPVRDEFFATQPKPPGDVFNVLITGGSRGARTLNRAAQESWPLFAAATNRPRLVLQAGVEAAPALRDEFAKTFLHGSVVEFIDDMSAAFDEADLIVCRSGAGAIAELAAAGKPSILVPFPFAADDHQKRNAEAFAAAGAARVLMDQDLTGRRLFDEIFALAADRPALARMGERARRFARPGAASRAADLLEELSRPTQRRPVSIDKGSGLRNNLIN